MMKLTVDVISSDSIIKYDSQRYLITLCIIKRIGGRQAAMSHHYFPFRTTTFDSSGQISQSWLMSDFKMDLV